MHPSFRKLSHFLPAALIASLALSAGARAQTPSWTVITWNDQGIQWIDSDYGVYSLMPPGNTLQVQLIDNASDLVTVPGGITVTYEAVAGPAGSANLSSIGKTNFWSFVTALFGVSPAPDVGLNGSAMPGAGNAPQPTLFNAPANLFEAAGIPITPLDDQHLVRHYPLMKVEARSAGGSLLASAETPLPVSDRSACATCHASGVFYAPPPPGGWVYDANPERDYRLNILKLHDGNHLNDPVYQGTLAGAGYNAAGLYDTVVTGGTPIRCTTCHASNTLPGSGFSPAVPPLTTAIHERHKFAFDPVNMVSLDQSTTRSSCYLCHPGAEAHFLRGAMNEAVASNGNRAIECQNCHGSMSDLADPLREGWLDEPSCQSCHTGTAVQNNGQIRYDTVFEANGSVRQATNQTFATNPNVPQPGKSLYRFSEGHGGLRCEACHGPTHGEYPSRQPTDNAQSMARQNHEGMLIDCTGCHNQMPQTVTGGPHGMHPIGQDWVDDHGDIVENLPNPQQCRVCHGLDYKGTVLSYSQGNRTFSAWGQKNFWRGFRIGCFNCHDGPNDDDPINNLPPVVQGASAATTDTPVTIPLIATDPNNNPITLRVVKQPAHGRVTISGLQATYYPDAGFAGPDTFTYAAWDGFTNSNLGLVTVTRGAEWSNYGAGYPGSGGTVPAFTLSGAPSLGAPITLSLQNTSGATTQVAVAASLEPAHLPTWYGGTLLVQPETVTYGTLPAAGALIPWTVTNDPSLIGQTLYAQAVQVDPGATHLLAFTRGLRIILGP